jgi:subtilisin family serine protease
MRCATIRRGVKMKRYLEGVAVTAAFVLLFAGGANAQLPEADVYYAPDAIVVQFDSDIVPLSPIVEDGVAVTGIQAVDELAHRFGVTEIKCLFPLAEEKGEIEMAGYYRFTFTGETGLEEVLSAYNNLAMVNTAEPVAIHRVNFYPNDPYRSSQWALGRIDAYQAWDITQGDPDVALAILDTGVDWDHPDLNGDIWLNTADPIGGGDDDHNSYIDDYRGWDFVTGISGCWPGEDCSGEDNNPMDFAGHGTHVAGIAAAETNNGTGVAGVGFDCKIMILRIGWLADDGWGYVRMDFAAEALYYAANKGARAANCSWGSSYDSDLSAAVTYAHNHGVLIVTAAGNDGNTTQPWLATRSGVIAVAATDQSDNKVSWSNYGTWVDIAAPGVSILSTYYNNDYEYLDGTSMSAPFVVGVAGLIVAADPSLTRSEVHDLIIDGAEPIDDYYYNQGWLGSGRLNAYNAVEGLGGLDPPEPSSPVNGMFTSDPYPTFTWSEVDGATVYHLQVDQGPSFPSPDINNSSITETYYTSPNPLADGIWYWRVRSGDGGDWSDWSTVEDFGIDTQPPGSPIGFDAVPDGWSNDPTFILNWTNPPDLSGINFAFYKLDQPPTNDFDFDGYTALDGEPPGEYVFPSTGSRTIYVWLVDNVDNTDYTTYVQDDMQYDGIPPAGCEASSPLISEELSFDVSWTAGSDEDSGISGFYDVQYRDGEGAWTPWLVEFEGTSEAFTGEDGHTYYFEARCYDNAGNAEPFVDIAETQTTIDTEYIPGCDYISGDVDNNGVPLELGDVIAMVGLYRGTLLPYFTCDCPPHGDEFAASSDPNGNCVPFELNDVVVEIGAFRGTDIPSGCADCPGSRLLSAPGAPALKMEVNERGALK